MKQSHYIIIAMLLIGLALGAAVVSQNGGISVNNEARENALTQPYAAMTGNRRAKVTIVEFMDPACETCRRFHPMVKRLLDRYDGKVNLVIRYAPLHKGSDQMVAILEAAKKQRKFWEVLTLMFDTQSQWVSRHTAQPEIFWGYLEKGDFDVARLRRDIKDPQVLKNIEQDIADGQFLGATKTPTFFVNGKPLPSFGLDQLKALVRTEVEAHY